MREHQSDMKTPIKVLTGLLLVAGLLLLAGCVVTSVYPYFTAKDVVVDELLVGKWADPDDAAEPEKYWQFARTNGQAYSLVIHDGEESQGYLVHLFKLKGRRFIDAEPTARKDDLIPPHYLLQVHRLDASGLTLSIMDYKWLEKLVERDPSAIEHLWVDRNVVENKPGRVILTANTPKLQKLILKYAGDTNAFSDLDQMLRK